MGVSSSSRLYLYRSLRVFRLGKKNSHMEFKKKKRLHRWRDDGVNVLQATSVHLREKWTHVTYSVYICSSLIVVTHYHLATCTIKCSF